MGGLYNFIMELLCSACLHSCRLLEHTSQSSQGSLLLPFIGFLEELLIFQNNFSAHSLPFLFFFSHNTHTQEHFVETAMYFPMVSSQL